MTNPQPHVPGALHDPSNLSGLTGPGENDQHSHGNGKYIAVFVALCVLTSMSVFTYSRFWPFPNQPHVAWAFMMAVSFTKAALVILFFMHIKYEANWKYVLTIPAGLMSIFLMLMLVPDVGMRLRTASQERLKHMAVQKLGDTEAETPKPTPAPPANK